MECVDYFTHEFDALDLHYNWKKATKQKLIRLENLTWRRFFQKQFHLKRLDPLLLNWDKSGWFFAPLAVKDSDLDIINYGGNKHTKLKRMEEGISLTIC